MDYIPEPVYAPREEQDDVLKSIRKAFESQEQDVDESQITTQDDDDDDEEGLEIDLEDQNARTKRLKPVVSSLNWLWDSGYERMDETIESIADGVREPRWRIPVGESGILDFVLGLIHAPILPHTLKVHILRLVGNSCADTDENRARVVSSNSLSSIVLMLNDTTLLPFAIPVLYNICIDYEPAQQQASKSLLGKELINLISSPVFNDNRALLGYTCKILGLLVTQPSEIEVAPENSAIVLLGIAADREHPCDMEDFVALANTAIAYLQHEKFQQALVSHGFLDTTLAVLVDSYTRFDSHPSIGLSSPEEDEAVLSQMRSNLNQVLSDVSALQEFQDAYPVVSPFSSSLRRWLSSPQLQLQVCACIMLGNLARSDAACEEFVHTSQVHKPLIAILNDTSDSQLLHAAIGFLKNLALPAKNKEDIGDAGALDILPRLWALDSMQQIQFSSISLTRQLVRGTHNNVRRLWQRLSEDPDSPANMRSHLSLLITIFDRTDVEPTKMEIARLMLAVCRVVSTSTYRSPERMQLIRKKFFAMHPEIGRPLGFMISQTKWPALRSEAWFVFALMARHPEGAEYISTMLNDAHIFTPLVGLLTEKDLTSPEALSPSTTSLEAHPLGYQVPETPVEPPPKATDMTHLDRENALVLISELLKNWGSEMAVLKRGWFEDLLKDGGQRVISEKEPISLSQQQLQDLALRKNGTSTT